MTIERKIFESQVKAFDDENLTVEHFISTEHKDRGGDIMRAKGMKIVGKPVVLLLHGRGPMGSEPVAKPLSITIDEFKGQPGILAKTQFFPDEIGQRLYAKVKGGFLPNWSIGYAIDEAKDIVESGRYAGRDVTKWQLLEYSPVGVPMNPFAQTIKEFLDKTEKIEGPFEIPESPWFGVVDVEECKGCGQGCTKHEPGKCETCKAEVAVFMKDNVVIGTVCEKCQPEEFARLQKEIEEKAPDPMEARMAKMETMMTAMDARCKKMEDAMAAMSDAMKSLGDSFAKLEPLLKTLPPEPEGGDKGERSEGNPPEGETPPRLVFTDEAREAKEKKARDDAAAISAVRDALRPVFSDQVNRLLGKVS